MCRNKRFNPFSNFVGNEGSHYKGLIELGSETIIDITKDYKVVIKGVIGGQICNKFQAMRTMQTYRKGKGQHMIFARGRVSLKYILQDVLGENLFRNKEWKISIFYK